MYSKSLATGLIKPKTTALFFDKLWVPCDSEFWGICIPDSISFVTDFLNDSEVYKWHTKASKNYWKGYCNNWDYDYFRKQFFVEEEIKNFKGNVLYSNNRNSALIENVLTLHRRFNINMTPLFFEDYLFSDAVSIFNRLSWNERDNIRRLLDSNDPIMRGFLENSKEMSTMDIEAAISNTLSNIRKTIGVRVCIQNIPSLVEETLEWRQVEEIRSDTESLASIRKLKLWLEKFSNAEAEGYIAQSIESALFDYSSALNKHGVATILGGFSVILTASSLLANCLLSYGPREIITASCAITATAFSFTAQELSKYYEKKKDPIAFLYNLEQKFK